MATADILNRTKSIIYGQGLGESPAIRRVAANADESISGSLITFDLLAGEGASVSPGDTLSVYGSADVDSAHALYVLDVSTDQVTAINGYLGTAAVAANEIDGALMEQKPLVLEHEIYESIDTIIPNMLWPHVYDSVQATITTPDLVDGQEAVAAEAEEITHAWQIIGPTAVNIAVTRQPVEVATAIASTGKMCTFDWCDGSTGYYLYRAKYTSADETDTELTRLIATGAAALALGATLSETSIESTKKDNAEAAAQRQSVANSLWRDFLTLRQNMSEELSKRLPLQIYVNRG